MNLGTFLMVEFFEPHNPPGVLLKTRINRRDNNKDDKGVDQRTD